MQQSNGSSGQGSNCYSKLATFAVCLSLHFSSQIHNKQKYPVGLFQMMRKIRPNIIRGGGTHNNQMTVLAAVPAVTTNSKVSQFASSHFLHNNKQ
jgi:hypothetical protein